MPRFYIQSLFERRLDTLRQRQERAYQEIDDFSLKVEASTDEETANVFRSYMDVPCGFRYRGERLPEIPENGLPFVEEFLELNRREAALELKMRKSKFAYYESRVEPYVLWCYKLPWYHVEIMLGEAEKLSLNNVRELLDAVLHDEPKFATPEEVVDLNMDLDEVAGWERTFRHRRRHLVWLFQTALRLDEEVVYSYF
jgi:hypothetical protein